MATKPFEEDQSTITKESQALAGLDELAPFLTGEESLDTGRSRLDVTTPSSRPGATPGLSVVDEPLPSFQDTSKTPETSLFENRGVNRASAQAKQDIATGASLGLKIGSAQTGQEEFASAETLVQVLASAGTGFLLGGPAGAMAGGLAAGLSAFLSTRATKKARKNQDAKEARYQKMVRQQIAREDKFKKQDRFDKLENQGYNRRASKFENRANAYKEFNSQIMAAISNNQNLKTRFASRGF